MPGVRVGHCTVSWGGPDLPHGSGPARTGVTAIFPHGGDVWHERVVAGAFVANGVGEVIGISAIREWGLIETPILLTNSQSAGAVYDATVRWMMDHDPRIGIDDAVMPVVGECDDGFLNDLRGMHVKEEHVREALDGAAGGPVAEGCVGAGTGMTCFDFKAGIGTSSRVVTAHGLPFTVGVLALTNFGVRHRFMVDGVPVGREIADLMPRREPRGLLHRRARHRRAAVAPGNASAWPSAVRSVWRLPVLTRPTAAARSWSPSVPPIACPVRVRSRSQLTSVANEQMHGLFEAAVDATAESVVTRSARRHDRRPRRQVAHALPLDRLVAAMRKHGREARLPDGRSPVLAAPVRGGYARRSGHRRRADGSP